MHGVDPALAPNEADRLRGLHAANWLVDSRLDDAVALVLRSDAKVRDPTHPPTRCEIGQKTSFDYVSNHRSLNTEGTRPEHGSSRHRFFRDRRRRRGRRSRPTAAGLRFIESRPSPGRSEWRLHRPERFPHGRRCNRAATGWWRSPKADVANRRKESAPAIYPAVPCPHLRIRAILWINAPMWKRLRA